MVSLAALAAAGVWVFSRSTTISDDLLDQLGPSLIGHQSLFLYGGTGNGKTSIAERILRIYQDTVVIPYAVEVDGHIVSLFDPVDLNLILWIDC